MLSVERGAGRTLCDRQLKQEAKREISVVSKIKMKAKIIEREDSVCVFSLFDEIEKS